LVFIVDHSQCDAHLRLPPQELLPQGRAPSAAVERNRIVAKTPHSIDPTKDFELRLATTLAPMLLTVAVFALVSLSNVSRPDITKVDELLAIVAGISIFAAALLVDHVLDSLQVGTGERFTFLSFGYLFFCVVVGFMTAAVFVIYSSVQAQAQHVPFDLQKSFIPFALAGLSVSGKMMCFRDREGFFYAMLVCYGLSIYVLLAP
jgi:hypothetical protein